MRWRASALFSSSDVTGASSSLSTHVYWSGNNVSHQTLAHPLSTQHGLSSNHSAATPPLRRGGMKRSSWGKPVSHRQRLSWRLRCHTLGRSEDIDTEGVVRSYDPRSTRRGTACLTWMCVQAVLKAVIYG